MKLRTLTLKTVDYDTVADIAEALIAGIAITSGKIRNMPEIQNMPESLKLCALQI